MKITEARFVSKVYEIFGYGSSPNAPELKAEWVLINIFRHLTPGKATDLLLDLDEGRPAEILEGEPLPSSYGPRGRATDAVIYSTVIRYMLDARDKPRQAEPGYLSEKVRVYGAVEKHPSTQEGIKNAIKDLDAWEQSEIQNAVKHGLKYTPAMRKASEVLDLDYETVRKRIERMNSPQLAVLKKALKRAGK